MKSLLLLVIALAISVASARLSVDEESKVFGDYLNNFKIRFGRSENLERRRRIFVDRFNAVEAHNEKFLSGKSTYKMEVNEFAHLTVEELNQQKLGHVHVATENLNSSTPLTRGRRTLGPQNFDWRTTRAGVVRPVQNQGSCGSCWAFGSIAAIEGQMAIRKGLYDKLSEQELIECVRYNGQLLGCNGGWDVYGYWHSQQNYGVTSLENNPYVGTTVGRLCYLSKPRTAGSQVALWTTLPARDEANMRDVLFTVGPMYVSFYVANNFYSYSSGIYSDDEGMCVSNTTNHGILLIGYGTENGVDYWLLKNSWGTGWGDSGFFKVKRGVGLCGIDLNSSYPTLV